ncbi:PREDICTED: targeting protein for Xklp2 [Vollenhovia emeryi]|uniref:targeting protein for Xklp2 n=1 Tax=Vollenhovia emeryi TaxID=411798 RepID=UPI0005F55F15|nr:PREDICTED: targeting protein for Xklp2 [Vollenhovia emeryi]XP_011869825.1 PREDICTED: targeting protein for Xklp2 [Vollenhovia emeryi]
MMGDYYELHAPQWVDFTETHSPIRVPDFFEKPHEVHERAENLGDPTCESTEIAQPAQQPDVTCASTMAQADLDIIKNTPIKMISPKTRNNKATIVETTYDEVLGDAMRKLELCKKPPKRDVANEATQMLNANTPNMSKIAKLSRSVGCRSVSSKCVPSGQDPVTSPTKLSKSICVPNNGTSASAKKTRVSHALLKQDENCTEHNDPSGSPDDLTDDSNNEREKQVEEESGKGSNEENNEKGFKKGDETDGEEQNEEEDRELRDESGESANDKGTEEEAKKEAAQDDVDAAIKKGNERQSSNKHTVLTWCNHRPSMLKRRVSIKKKYVSLAEAVSRFQNDTPERFHTRSNKSGVDVLNATKLMQNRLKPTIPISPALVSKTRARPVTALSREEREKLEVEEMRKHKIKANPIPRNVLRGPRGPVVTKSVGVAKRSTTATQSNEKVAVTSISQPKILLPHRKKVASGPKNVVKVLATDPSSIIVDHEEITFFGVPKDTGATKNVTRIMPFSFEARNKNLQMKKEQRLKSLQEANQVKTEFHARPVPNFSKPPTPRAKQQQEQQQDTKKPILPCPFSFDDRNKKAFERKEQLVKQVFEEDKRARVFRANPAPVFKPVMVRGRSKESLLAKDKNTASEQAENQENKEPNSESSKTGRENIRKSKSVASIFDKQKVPLKAYPLTLNTDKRAKEREEFNEKIKRKEMEEEAKCQEIEKKRLESEKEMKAKLRKLTEMKARPMPAYKSPMVIKSTKPLTDPHSPAFASKLRSKRYTSHVD